MSEKISHRFVIPGKGFIIFILLALSAPVYSQVIKGYVMDINTHTKIDFAAVYINGTFIGSNTDKSGYFELDITGYKTMPVSVSALGYNSINLPETQSGIQYMIYLEPKVYQLQEVVVTARGDWLERRTDFFIFKKEFLGNSVNAAMCTIRNEDDIIINYKLKSDTLYAFSMNPVVIINKSLGYNIIYYLDRFETSYSTSYLLLLGNYKFSDDTTKNENQVKRYEKRRLLAYSGSRMHFFRSLWENNLDSAGFTIKDSTNKVLTYNDIVIQDSINQGPDDLKYLKYKGTLNIAYHSKLPQTQIRMLKDTVGFARNGFFDPLGIGWKGEMSKQRTGDLLPFEYRPK